MTENTAWGPGVWSEGTGYTAFLVILLKMTTNETGDVTVKCSVVLLDRNEPARVFTEVIILF